LRIALDTNVLISAYTARGLSADVYRLILAEHDLVIPDVVLYEFERILKTKFGIPAHHVDEFVEDLNLHEVIETPSVTEGLEIIRDPDDSFVVAGATIGNAATLITGDKDILDVRDQLDGIVVQTPREFWESIRNGS
jgi:uncharacterized protein